MKTILAIVIFIMVYGPAMAQEQLEKSASCYVIIFAQSRSFTTEADEFSLPRLQLLDICPRQKKGLPKIKIRRDGKEIETSFEVKKIFESKEEARTFADRFGVTDESMRLFDIPKCKLIRDIQMPLRKQPDAKTTPTIALLNVCLPSESNKMQHPMITFEENGKQISRIFEVVQTFDNRQQAEKYAKENSITDIQISQRYTDHIVDCHIIRIEEIPLTKRPGVKTESKIALLNTCLNDEIPQQRPVIEVIRNGKTEFREFEIIKIFVDKQEAEIFAKENGVTDVEFRK